MIDAIEKKNFTNLIKRLNDPIQKDFIDLFINCMVSFLDPGNDIEQEVLQVALKIFKEYLKIDSGKRDLHNTLVSKQAFLLKAGLVEGI